MPQTRATLWAHLCLTRIALVIILLNPQDDPHLMSLYNTDTISGRKGDENKEDHHPGNILKFSVFTHL